MAITVGGPEHAMHRWRMVFHLDGCHHYTSGYSCSCGAQMSVWRERTFRRQIPSPMADLDECERCQALAAGSRRRPRRVQTTYPEGATWEPRKRRR